MGSKYKKNKPNIVDLHERGNIKIISSEKHEVTDNDIHVLEKKMQLRSNNANEFCEYLICKNLEEKKEISKNEFEIMMKEIKKQHKILRFLLNEKEK